MKILKKIKERFLGKKKPVKQHKKPPISHEKFEDFYVDHVSRKIKRNQGGHPTLSVDSNKANFIHSGTAIIDHYKTLGLEKQTRVVDYGCGSLRIGRHFIEHLNPNCYFGLDVTDRFYQSGLTDLDPLMLDEKQPQFGIIGQELYQQLIQSPVDFLFSVGVIIHIPPDQLERYFNTMLPLVSEQGQVIVKMTTLNPPDETIQKNKTTWHHSLSSIQQAVEKQGWQMSVFSQNERSTKKHKGKLRVSLLIKRA